MNIKLIFPLLLLAALSACGPTEPPKQEANVPSVEALAADPERLKELRRQCKTDRPAIPLCLASLTFSEGQQQIH